MASSTLAAPHVDSTNSRREMPILRAFSTDARSASCSASAVFLESGLGAYSPLVVESSLIGKRGAISGSALRELMAPTHSGASLYKQRAASLHHALDHTRHT